MSGGDSDVSLIISLDVEHLVYWWKVGKDLLSSFPPPSTSLRKFSPRGANVKIFHYWQLFSPNHYWFLTQFSKQCSGDDEVIPDLYKSNALVSEYVAMTFEGITGYWCTKGLWCMSTGNCLGHTRDIFFTLLAVASICALLSLSCTHYKMAQWLCSIRLHFSLLHNSSLAAAGIRTPARRCMIWNSSQQRWAELWWMFPFLSVRRTIRHTWPEGKQPAPHPCNRKKKYTK